MNYLFIDTSERFKIRLALIPDRGAIRDRTVSGRRSPVSVLASFIKKPSLQSLTGVIAVAGPGPFSAIRSGVLVANLLSRMYHIPLYGVFVEEAWNLKELQAAISSDRLRASAYVAPVYDREPNITIKPLACPSA